MVRRVLVALIGPLDGMGRVVLVLGKNHSARQSNDPGRERGLPGGALTAILGVNRVT